MHEQCSLNLKIIVFLLHGGDDDNDYAMHEQCSLNMKISDEADTVSRLIMVVAMVVMQNVELHNANDDDDDDDDDDDIPT